MKSKEEIWKNAQSLPSNVHVSSFGNVRIYTDMNHFKDAKLRVYNGLYCFNFMGATHQVHRAVAEAFIPNPEGYRLVKHRNGNKLDNNIENLEWCASTDNLQKSRAWKDGIYCVELDEVYGSLRTASYCTGVHPDFITASINDGISVCGLTFSKVSSTESQYTDADFAYVEFSKALDIAKKSKTVGKFTDNILKQVEKERG